MRRTETMRDFALGGSRREMISLRVRGEVEGGREGGGRTRAAYLF